MCSPQDGNTGRVSLNATNGIDVLGNIVEASTLSPNPIYYGSLHNEGHNAISYIHDPDQRYLVNEQCFSPPSLWFTRFPPNRFYSYTRSVKLRYPQCKRMHTRVNTRRRIRSDLNLREYLNNRTINPTERYCFEIVPILL